MAEMLHRPLSVLRRERTGDRGQTLKVGQHVRRRGRIMARAITVHPDARDADAARRLDVMEPTAGGMHPVAVGDAGLPLELAEVAKVGFVAADLLRGDDQIRVRTRKPFERARKQIVVAVGQDADLEAARASSDSARDTSSYHGSSPHLRATASASTGGNSRPIWRAACARPSVSTSR